MTKIRNLIILIFILFTPIANAGIISLYYTNPVAVSAVSNFSAIHYSSFYFSTYYTNYLLFPYLLSPAPQQFIDNDIFKKDTTYKSTMLPNSTKRRQHPSFHHFGEDNPKGFDVKSSIDTNDVITSSESVDGQSFGNDLEMDLDSYLNLRKKQLQTQLWDSISTDYDLKKTLKGSDLARMISASTGLDIPIPQNPLTSIFGAPKVNFNVNGEVNVRIGWRWDTQDLGTVSQFGQTQSTPIFSQDVRVNVSGGIGDKLKLNTDWNTKRSFDLNNKFKIGFEGEDDDIVKLVEFGNVSLPTQNSLIGGGQTLFGVRADFQFGPLFFKTILSQKKGERKFINANGGQTRTNFSLRAYDYAKNHFFLDNEYKQVYKDYFKYSTPTLPNNAHHLGIKDIEVWESVTQINNVNIRNVIAIDTLPKIGYGQDYPASFANMSRQPGKVAKGRFQLLDSNKYFVDRNLGTITIKNLSPDKSYAVAYVQEGGGEGYLDDKYSGYMSSDRGFDTSRVQILKLIYDQTMRPNYDTLWSRQMKNIFNIGSSNVNLANSKIGIWYMRPSNDSVDVLEGVSEKLVTILGVDRRNTSGQVTPDGEFDMALPYLDARTGEITFPHIEPFGDGLRDYFEKIKNPSLADLYTFDDVYDTTYDVARRNTARDRFVISGEIEGKQSSVIRLGAFNLSPGSVRVFLDGVQLKEFQDYVVNYYSGTVQMRNSRATLPNANLKIEYEQQDIFQVSTKTLAGIRADYNIFQGRRARADIGATFMHYNQSAVIDRVQLGQEPVANSMLGFDARLNWDTPFITEALDLLPFYDTKAKSSLDITTEWAMIMPDPNKRKSTVDSDDGKSVVYLDDFEGAQRRITLGLNPSLWQHSSSPLDEFIAKTPEERNNYKGKMSWWQRFIPYVDKKEIWPKQQSYVGQGKISPLEFYFEPNKRGIYNRNPEFLDEKNGTYFNSQAVKFWQQNDSNGVENEEKIWGGMQRLLSSFNTNFDTENIEYIELTMKIDVNEGARLYIDLGQISEDIIPNDLLDTEDGITQESPLPNGLVDLKEDVGIDALSNEQEKNSLVPGQAYPFPLNEEADPARDDYSFNFGKDDRQRVATDFANYNNFENNSKSEVGNFPDSEILNDNNGQTIATANSYFRYEVDLNTDPIRNSQIVGVNNNWYKFRIPIRKPLEALPGALFSNIQYIRILAQGGRFKANIADWALVGSQWQRLSNFQSDVPENDSILQIAFVNVFENSDAPDFYSMPPGVRAPRQLNSPDPNQEILLNEQSMSVCVKNLRYGEERMAVKVFQPQDLFYYKELKFFFHGDGSMPISMNPGSVPKAYAYLRFGIDSSNYYEYRQPLVQGWQDIGVNLRELTTIKTRPDRDMQRLYERQEFPAGEYGTFAIKGNPILTRVQFIGVGISNPKERYPNELTTCMWINEIRLIGAENDNDWAALTSASLKLADLGDINASFNKKLPNFHRLEERFGDRANAGDFSFSAQGNLEKFAPKSFKGMKVPISYSHSEYLQTPEFEANSDINLNETINTARAVAITNGATETEANSIADSILKKSQSLKVMDSWSLTGVKLGIPINHWSINQTLNKATITYSYAQEYERNPIYENRFRWNWLLDLSYNNNIPEFLAFQPMGWAKDMFILDAYSDWKVNLLPSSFSLGLKTTRGRQTEQSRFLTFASPIIRNFTADRQIDFNWKLSQNGLLSPSINYSVTTMSSLLRHEFDEEGRQRNGSEIAKSMFFNNGFIDFGDNTQYNQTVNINVKPTFPAIFGIHKFLTINGSFNTNYSWFDPLQPDPEIRDLVKNVSFNNTINFKAGLNLMDLGNSWFGIAKKPKFARDPRQDSIENAKRNSSILKSIGMGVKFILLDFEKIDFTFTQMNNATNPGVYGGTGSHNFWGRGLTFRNSNNSFGPGFAYQMGLVANPHGSIDFAPSSSFPFIGFNTSPGLRPQNGTFTDSYNQRTNLQMSTKRPLWEGATLELNWGTTKGYDRNQTVITVEDGVPRFQQVRVMETFDRTYISLPSVFGLNLFDNTVEGVVDEFNQKRAAIEQAGGLDSTQKNRAVNLALANSFYEALEAFSLTGKSGAGKFLPAINWGITWEGLEKWSIWSDYVKKVSINHGYISKYTEAVRVTDLGRVIENQQVQAGFSPVLGISTSFDESKLDGTLTASFDWNFTTGYNLNAASKSTITSQSSNELTAKASYTMEGFEMSLLGIKLENELEFSFIGSYKANGRGTFDILDEKSFEGGKQEGRVLDGSTQILVEPRIRYSMSERLTAAFFVRYEGNFNEGASSPGYHTTQVGLDVRISIAGGR